jgi:hypothetical protein
VLYQGGIFYEVAEAFICYTSAFFKANKLQVRNIDGQVIEGVVSDIIAGVYVEVVQSGKL